MNMYKVLTFLCQLVYFFPSIIGVFLLGESLLYPSFLFILIPLCTSIKASNSNFIFHTPQNHIILLIFTTIYIYTHILAHNPLRILEAYILFKFLDSNFSFLQISVLIQAMKDWAPPLIASALFAILTPGAILQMPGRYRPVEFMSMRTSWAAIFVHAVLFGLLLMLFLVILQAHLYL